MFFHYMSYFTQVWQELVNYIYRAITSWCRKSIKTGWTHVARNHVIQIYFCVQESDLYVVGNYCSFISMTVSVVTIYVITPRHSQKFQKGVQRESGCQAGVCMGTQSPDADELHMYIHFVMEWNLTYMT